MDKETVQIIIMITTIFIVVVAIMGLGTTIRQFKRQLRLNFFADYTKRYQEIILNFPEEINKSDFDFSNFKKEENDKTLRDMRAYFDLCSEEYFLSLGKNIDKKTWTEWKSGIEYAFSKKAFQDGWELISLDTIYYTEFTKFVKEILVRRELNTLI